MLPRILLRNCDLAGAACLDMGSMEGLMSVLMTRGGASRVLAIDGRDHCVEKLAAVGHYYDVSVDYRTVGPMYSLTEKLGGEGFDLINCSGLLYHVFSPLMVLAGVRGALKRNGLMLIATNVTLDREPRASFNAKGRFQHEAVTYWYLSTGLLDYLLRYLRLAPIDCIYQAHDLIVGPDWRLREGDPCYVAVLCRAVDEILPTADDTWMPAEVGTNGWEYDWVPDWGRADAQPASRIRTSGASGTARDDLGATADQVPPVIDVTRAVEQGTPYLSGPPSDSHTLRLDDVR
jgi:SAM-dependent methyltransferase